MTGSGSGIGLAMSTVGRPSLSAFLDSVALSDVLPEAVAIADHTPGRDLTVHGSYPFPVRVVPSTGGASRGRNEAVATLPPSCHILGFPNDDNLYTPSTLPAVLAAFAGEDVAAVAGTLLDVDRPRFHLPPDGEPLDRRTVWRASEPAMFIRREAFAAVHGFRDDLGTGAESPWQSGDGTDVLLQIMQRGERVLSGPAIVVVGKGERKGLSEEALVSKHRMYARGTGFVYRTHRYPLHAKVRILLGPLLQATRLDPALRLSLRLSVARTAGRLEGLTGRPLPRARDWS